MGFGKGVGSTEVRAGKWGCWIQSTGHQETRAELDQGPPAPWMQLGQARVQSPAPTLSPGSGPSVTLFLPVQDVLLREGVEAPPFLPDLALPPSSSGLQKGSWLSSRGRRDVAEGAGAV